MSDRGHTAVEALQALDDERTVYQDCRVGSYDWTELYWSDCGRRHLSFRDPSGTLTSGRTSLCDDGFAIEGCTGGPDGGPCEFCASCPHLDNDLPEPLHEGCKVWPVYQPRHQDVLVCQKPGSNGSLHLHNIISDNRWTGVYGYEVDGEVSWQPYPRMRQYESGNLFMPEHTAGIMVYPDYVEMEARR